ncbi:MAG: PhoH family protein [Elusimicrobia bacterium]|nr:PhoH family protein [Elusimicrobiota bacterium]
MKSGENSFTGKLKISGNEEARRAFGHYDRNLKRIEKENKVKIFARGNTATVTGERENVEKSISELKRLSCLSLDDNQTPGEKNEFLTTYRGAPVRAMGPLQADYLSAIEKNDLTVAIGPAGTGKTFLACAAAVKMFYNKEVERIILTRPVVEAGEKLGYLPGDLQEKINPYVRPLYDAFYTIMGADKFERFYRENLVELLPLAYMRGRTLSDAAIILDEAQNTTTLQMKMFLTRIGFNSKTIVTGDITQIDLEDESESGLVEIQEVLKNVSGVQFVYFKEDDVVRHRLVRRIINAYKKYKSTEAYSKK